MKRIAGTLFAIGCVAALGFALYFFSKTRAETLAAALPVAGRSAVVASGEPGSDPSGDSGNSRTQARIAPDPVEQVLDTIDINLDDDEDLEQVLTVRKPGSPGEAIRVVVADFQPENGTWFRLWSGDTLADKPVSFAIQVKDLVGDGGSELLCFGPDASGRQTLTVFKRTYGRNGQAFESIFSEAAESIEIDEADLKSTEEAKAGASLSLSISVYRAVQDAENPLDRVKTVYRWSPSARRYRPGESESVPGAEIERDLRSKILTGDAEDFKAYIDGVWIAPGGEQRPRIDFDSDSGRISFQSDEANQVWKWSASSPSTSGLLAATVNESLPELLRLVDIQLTGPDRLRIRVLDEQVLRLGDRNIWNGDYVRLGAADRGTAPSGADITEDNRQQMKPVRADFVAGYWMSSDGKVLAFEGTRFRSGGAWEHRSGGFSLFGFGTDLILDLLPVDGNGVPQAPLRYIVLVPAVQSGPDRIRLRPVVLKSQDATLLYAPEIELRKISEDRMEKLQSVG